MMVTMVKMIDCVSGVPMWVAENRVDEYLAAGHKLAVSKPEKPAEAPKSEKVAEKPAAKTAKKPLKKK